MTTFLIAAAVLVVVIYAREIAKGIVLILMAATVGMMFVIAFGCHIYDEYDEWRSR